MDTTIINIPCTIDRDELIKRMHIKPNNSTFIKTIDKLVDHALKIGNPKLLYKVSYVDFKGDDFVIIDGIKFTSRVLRVNLEETFKVVPYVVTCGTELEEWTKNINGMFDVFCADGIKETILYSALEKSFAIIDEELKIDHAVNMNPGSLPDWPVKEQKALFQLLGDVKSFIGVELKESFLMSPIKSVSGFRFPMEGTYENCMLCSRENCPGRKAPYEKNLYTEKYQQKTYDLTN